MMQFRILFQDSHLIAIHKPGGMHVHPPEDSRLKIPRSKNCLFNLRKQIGIYLYPVHRLDAATSGVLLFGLKPETAQAFGQLFLQQAIAKNYYCVARGWTENEGTIDRPLGIDGQPPVAALTRYQTVARAELPYSIGKRYSTSRYSLLRLEPLTGRRHQIRRHLAGVSHPLIGDTTYGDLPHNHFFAKTLTIPGLLLKAQSVEFTHPFTGAQIKIISPWRAAWHKVFDIFGACPWNP
jgi:tRNA pseudouridine65 synthase